MVFTESKAAQISRENDSNESNNSIPSENKESNSLQNENFKNLEKRDASSISSLKNHCADPPKTTFTSPPSNGDTSAAVPPEHVVHNEKDIDSKFKDEVAEKSAARPSTETNPTLPPPPDGGWGWAVVFGCAIFHFTFLGVGYAAGVLYIGLRSEFPDASSAELATIMSTMLSVHFFLSPLASWLLRCGFSERQVIVVGGICAGGGYLIAAFSPTITGIRISIGLFVGFAGALCGLPSFSLLGQYFERRRALATGLAVLGAGLGGFAVPPLVALALDEYGLQGALLLIAAFVLNLCFGGMLHRPLRRSQRTEESPPPASEKSFTSRRCLDFLLQLPVQLLHLLRSPFLRPPIVLFLFAQLLQFPAVWVQMNFLPSLSQIHGVDEITASTLSSITNGGSAVGRLLVAFTMDLPLLRRRRVAVAAGAMFLSVAVDVGVIFAASYAEFAVYAIFRGILDGLTITFRLLVLQDLTGREGYTDALGFVAIFMGIGMLAVPPIAGVVVDGFGIYAAFALSASMHFVSGVVTGIVAWQKWNSSSAKLSVE